MLKEIFDKIGKEMEGYFLQKGITVKTLTGDTSGNKDKDAVHMALQDYGIDPLLKTRMPLNDESANFSNYSHLLSFYMLPVSASYEKRLHLLETIVEFFEVKPFFQLTIHKEEFELAISMKAASTHDFHQFWIARQQPPQPVIFYQARLSAI